MIKNVKYCSNFLATKGRMYKEEEDINRTVYQRDRDRIIHSAAFRRLEHKTQVFVHHEGDHFRSRLTHTLEVSQIARTLARIMRLDEDLAEAISLAHDLGHTPFGHAGEDALNKCMTNYGGFDHNAQTLRIITFLEKRYVSYDGLNLTWETLEGIVKHNGPIVSSSIPYAIEDYIKNGMNLEISTWCGPEAQVASLADDIAYCNHDIDDGIRAGLFTFEDLHSNVSLIKTLKNMNLNPTTNLDKKMIVNQIIRKLISKMIADVVKESSERLRTIKPKDTSDIRKLDKPIISFSSDMLEEMASLRLFLTKRMYKHPSVNRMTSKAKRIVKDLFNLFDKEPDCLPNNWRTQVINEGIELKKARIIADYIAGMTDRYAIYEHKKLFDLSDSW